MKKFLLFMLISSAFVANAQDCLTIKSTGFPLTGSPAASTGLNSISIVDANTIWVSARSGTPANNRRTSVSINGGETFTASVADLGAGSTNIAISNVWGVSTTTAFLSGNGSGGTLGGVWKTIDSGVTWTRQATAAYNTTTSFPNLVYFWDANNGVTMGDPASGYFEIYTTANGGTTWTRTPSSNMPVPRADLVDTEYGLTNKFSVTGNTIWIGTTYGRLLKSTNKGLNWTAIQTPIGDFGGALNAPSGFSGHVSFSTDNMGALIDSDYNFWRTSDGGTTWVQDANGIPRNFDIGYVPGSSTLINIGEDVVDGLRGTSYSYNNGVTWSVCPETINNGAMVGPLAVLNQNLFFVSGFATSTTVGGIFKYTGNQLPTTTFSNGEILSAYPNPTKGTFNLQSKDISSITVFDVLGKQIINKEYNALSSVSLDLSSYNNGIYLIKVFNAEGASSLIKVVKE